MKSHIAHLGPYSSQSACEDVMAYNGYTYASHQRWPGYAAFPYVANGIWWVAFIKRADYDRAQATGI